MARTYEAALSQLSALQSNRAITSLFAPPTPAPADATSQDSKKAQDLNAVAIPEVIAWLGRAGLSVSDLAKLKCVHVAGTKGKGSVCAYLTSILTQPTFRSVAGRVGTYTSPHLVSVRERIMLDGQPISQELFARYFFEVWDALTASARAEYLRQHPDSSDSGLDSQTEAELQGPASKPFYFRFLTILAFRVFLREGVNSAVIECGIGGEYDSTNVLPTDAVSASVVTQLGIDHVGMLGGTLPEIAWHKIGIAKAGRKCFTRELRGGQGEQTMQVMRGRSQEKGADLVEIKDSDVEAWGGEQPRESGGLEGQFQKYNQALAVAAAREHLARLGMPEYRSEVHFTDLPDPIRVGLRQARLRGRCETIVEDNITWLIDGAHTADSLQEVAKWFSGKLRSATYARTVLVFNQQERDADRLLKTLYEGLAVNSGQETVAFDRTIFPRNELRSRTQEEPERDVLVQKNLAQAFGILFSKKPADVVDNVSEAVALVRKSAARGERSEKTLVLVTGSLHLVGAVLQILEPEAPI